MYLTRHVNLLLLFYFASLVKKSSKCHISIFESYFFSERIKIGNNNAVFPPEIMFWRTRSGDEVDMIEKNGTEITAFECKWTKTQLNFEPFLRKYPKADVKVVTPKDLL